MSALSFYCAVNPKGPYENYRGLNELISLYIAPIKDRF